MLNPEKICHEHLTDLSTLPVTCSHFTLGNPKKSFSTFLFMYFRLSTLTQKKTSSNCCSTAIAVYLLLFSASYYLHNPSTASGARYRKSACNDMDVLRLVAAARCDMGGISARRCVLRDEQRQKKCSMNDDKLCSFTYSLLFSLSVLHVPLCLLS